MYGMADLFNLSVFAFFTIKNSVCLLFWLLSYFLIGNICFNLGFFIVLLAKFSHIVFLVFDSSSICNSFNDVL